MRNRMLDRRQLLLFEFDGRCHHENIAKRSLVKRPSAIGSDVHYKTNGGKWGGNAIKNYGQRR